MSVRLISSCIVCDRIKTTDGLGGGGGRGGGGGVGATRWFTHSMWVFLMAFELPSGLGRC